MDLSAAIKVAFKNLASRKLRAALTCTGIVVGIAAIVSLLLVGEGLEASITEQFNQMGANRIFVMGGEAGSGGGNSATDALSEDDIDTLDGMAEFQFVNPYLMSVQPVEFGRETVQMQIMGMRTDDIDRRFGEFDFEVTQGRLFKQTDGDVAILGARVVEDYFDKEIRVNNRIKIKDRNFKVIGIFKEFGNPEDDGVIYIPYDKAKDSLNITTLVAIDTSVKEGLDVELVKAKTERRLEKARNNENFQVMTSEQLLDQFGDVLSIVQIVLVGIAAISLIVGGLGILNAQYTAVLERTADIGIMKSLGARNNDIMIMFIFESALLGLIGGVLGGILGVMIGKGIEAAAAMGGFSILKVYPTVDVIIFGLAFAVIVSSISGYLPARSAAKMKPVEALRYD